MFQLQPVNHSTMKSSLIEYRATVMLIVRPKDLARSFTFMEIYLQSYEIHHVNVEIPDTIHNDQCTPPQVIIECLTCVLIKSMINTGGHMKILHLNINEVLSLLTCHLSFHCSTFTSAYCTPYVWLPSNIFVSLK